MTAFGTRLFVCCTILFMSSQVLLLFAVLMIFGAFYIAEIFRAVLQKIRLRQDKTASTPHQGEESTWNELTAHHRPRQRLQVHGVRCSRPARAACSTLSAVRPVPPGSVGPPDLLRPRGHASHACS